MIREKETGITSFTIKYSDGEVREMHNRAVLLEIKPNNKNMSVHIGKIRIDEMFALAESFKELIYECNLGEEYEKYVKEYGYLASKAAKQEELKNEQM